MPRCYKLQKTQNKEILVGVESGQKNDCNS